ncbi:MAG: alpha/beta fold hydrolase [Bacteroidia bacterium]|nr:alpha/beta fold hydrolase [Bacteroidia bacterium]
MQQELQLNYKVYGDQGFPLVIIHGLFGSLDNWASLAKRFSSHFQVFTIDQRNHGLSPHTSDFTIELLSNDLLHFLQQQQLEQVHLLGHSLGGKTAMNFAIEHPQRVSKMVVADIAPKAYPLHHQLILEALHSLDIGEVSSRKEAESILSMRISEPSTLQFLLKNLTWNSENKLVWKFNLESLTRNIQEVGAAQAGICTVESLFLRGDRSGYIQDSDFESIYNQFPFSEIHTIPQCGHWLHAEQPELFYREVFDFLV